MIWDFSGGRPVAVPASFNEQFTDYETFNHMGVVWYRRTAAQGSRFLLPAERFPSNDFL